MYPRSQKMLNSQTDREELSQTGKPNPRSKPGQQSSKSKSKSPKSLKKRISKSLKMSLKLNRRAFSSLKSSELLKVTSPP